MNPLQDTPVTAAPEQRGIPGQVAAHPSRRGAALATAEWIGVALLGVIVLVAAWSSQAALGLPTLATGLAATAVALIVGGLAGIAWHQLLPSETARPATARFALLSTTAVVMCALVGVILWTGSLAQSGSAAQGWTDFLNELLASSPDDVGVDASIASSVPTPVLTSVPAVSATAGSTAQAAATAQPVAATPPTTSPPTASRPVVPVAAQRPPTAQLVRQLDGAMLAAAAQALHLGLPELRSRLRAGVSLREVASTQEVPLSAVQEAIHAALTPLLTNAVQHGVISSAQRVSMLKAVLSQQFGTSPGLPRP